MIDPNLIMYTMVSEGEFAFDRDWSLMWRPYDRAPWGVLDTSQGISIVVDGERVPFRSLDDLHEYIAGYFPDMWRQLSHTAKQALRLIRRQSPLAFRSEIVKALGVSERAAAVAVNKLARMRLIGGGVAFHSDGRVEEAWDIRRKGLDLLDAMDGE